MSYLDDELEVMNPNLPRGRFRSVLFDFDGTLSLIREGWPQVMIPMMVGVLRETGTRENEADLTAAVEEFVMRLNGRQTIYQMIQLAEEVRRRGGRPLDPLRYKHRYHDLLMERIQGRLAALESGVAAASDWTVPGSHDLLEGLRRRAVSGRTYMNFQKVGLVLVGTLFVFIISKDLMRPFQRLRAVDKAPRETSTVEPPHR